MFSQLNQVFQSNFKIRLIRISANGSRALSSIEMHFLFRLELCSGSDVSEIHLIEFQLLIGLTMIEKTLV
jgi:hypothetical protein